MVQEYLEIVRHVLEHGAKKTDRTGTGTLSLFGLQTRYDLRKGFPLLTTKKVLFDAVVHELLWFLRGSTNIHAGIISVECNAMKRLATDKVENLNLARLPIPPRGHLNSPQLACTDHCRLRRDCDLLPGQIVA